MGQSHFFAADDDLLPVLEDVERRRPLKFARAASASVPETETFVGSASLPPLGRATGDQWAATESFLVIDADAPVVPREIRQTNGVVRYAFDLLLNPDALVLTPGGMWAANAVISGSVGTVPGGSRADSLLRAFRNALRRRFVRVRAFAVGPRALVLLRSGWRLTQAVQSPGLYDLREEGDAT